MTKFQNTKHKNNATGVHLNLVLLIAILGNQVANARTKDAAVHVDVLSIHHINL
jgi:hypothetical protein